MEPKIEYRLRSLEIVKLLINQKPQGFLNSEFNFDIEAGARVAPDKKVIFLVISIVTREINKEEPLAEIVTAVGFEIINFEDVIILNEEGLYMIPTDLEVQLRIIALSTTRGVMFSEFKGTYLHRALLPIVPQILQPQEQKAE